MFEGWDVGTWFKVSIAAFLIVMGLAAAYWMSRPSSPRSGDCFDPATELWIESADGCEQLDRER